MRRHAHRSRHGAVRPAVRHTSLVKARLAAGGGRWVEISPERIRAWIDGFYGRHGGATEQGLVLTGARNGDTATLHPPPGITGVHDIDTLLSRVARPPRIGVLLVRKGAVAVGVADDTTLVVSKVERFYVQGRTAAGGSSQQRYARRRANQAEAAAHRATDIAARVLLPYVSDGSGDPEDAIGALVGGGDRLMLDTVLADQRLSTLARLRDPRLLESAEPRLAVLAEAVLAARRVRVHLVP
jgi:hypothetical protein